MKWATTLLLVLVTGCGTGLETVVEPAPASEVVIAPTEIQQTAPDTVIQVIEHDSSVLAWGVFGGSPHFVYAAGGSIRVEDFIRHSEGVYEVVYDAYTSDIGRVAAVASAMGFDLEDYGNAIAIVSAAQITDRRRLTVSAIAVNSINLADIDTIFSLVIFGWPPD